MGPTRYNALYAITIHMMIACISECVKSRAAIISNILRDLFEEGWTGWCCWVVLVEPTDEGISKHIPGYINQPINVRQIL